MHRNGMVGEAGEQLASAPNDLAEKCGETDALTAKADFQLTPHQADEFPLSKRYGRDVDGAGVRPRVFIGMETSGQLRRRFAAKGCTVVSCDLLPAEDGSPNHRQGDVFAALDDEWAASRWPDIAVFHPDCTHLTNSAEWAYKDPDYARYPGVGYHQRVSPGTLVGAARRKAREEAQDQFRRIVALPIPVKAVENPVGALSRIRKPTQTVQPFQFGDDASKGTCLWLLDENGNDLPAIPVDPAKRVPGRMVNGRERWGNQTDNGQNILTPGPLRWKERARTYDGIADALVEHLLWVFGVGRQGHREAAE